jgi:DNA-binding NarL/FixJ family response regulator
MRCPAFSGHAQKRSLVQPAYDTSEIAIMKTATKPSPEAGTACIHVWLIEDHIDFRNTVVRVLAREDDLEVSAFSSCEDALDRLRTGETVHVILLDIGLPGMSGLEGITRFKAASPATQIIMLTAFDDRGKIRKAINAGATGYLLKTGAAIQIVESIREVLHGGAALDGHIAKYVLEMVSGQSAATADYALAPREMEVLRGLVAGKTIKEIADDLSVSYHTVDTYLRRIYQKMDVQSRSLAVTKALQERLI